MNKSNKNIVTWSIYNALMMTIGTIIFLFTSELNVLLILFSFSVLVLLYINWKSQLYGNYTFGLANWITLVRYIVIFLCLIFLSPKEHNLLFVFLSIAVILDFFDGKIARYFKEESFFGKYFDMEVDAFFVLIMCCYYYLYFDFSLWILIPGLLRYISRLYTFLFPKEYFVERRKKYAVIIAANFFIILLLGLVTKGILQYLLLMFGSFMILISFMADWIEYLMYSRKKEIIK